MDAELDEVRVDIGGVLDVQRAQLEERLVGVLVEQAVVLETEMPQSIPLSARLGVLRQVLGDSCGGEGGR